MKSRTIIAGTSGAQGFWMDDPVNKYLYSCSNCGQEYDRKRTKIPDHCPKCGMRLLKGSAAKKYRDIVRTLEKDPQGKNGHNIIIS